MKETKKTTAETSEVAVEDLRKEIGEEVMNAVKSANDSLKGTSFKSVEEALQTANDDNDMLFNPTISQYREGLVINTSRDLVAIKKVTVGKSSRNAWCITAPAGYQNADGEVVYSQAFNLYPSTLRKEFVVTDENGDPVLDEQHQPLPVNGKGNPIWEAARKCADSKSLIEFALDKLLKVSEIKRDFGPAYFADKAGSQKATGHKISSLPLFNDIKG